MEDLFGQVLVPTEELVEMRRGQKVNAERKFFPGYVLLRMEMTDESWHLVKNTPKVTGFLGNRKQTPISAKEDERILTQGQEGAQRQKPSIVFEIGARGRVATVHFTPCHGVGAAACE